MMESVRTVSVEAREGLSTMGFQRKQL